jgi:hypothetical protein
LRPRAVAPRILPVWIGLLILSCVALTGCGDDDDDGNPVNPGTSDATLFTGTFVGATEGGLMTMYIELPQAELAPGLAGKTAPPGAPAFAILSPDIGGTVNLSGTYDETTDSLRLIGPGYIMSGHYDPAGPMPGIAGTYINPAGAGSLGCAVGGTNTVRVTCGMYTDLLATKSGRWNLAIVGGAVHGLAYYGGQVLDFEGTAAGTGNTRTIAIHQELGGGAVLIADGTLNTTTGDVGGDWRIEIDSAVDDSGTWEGSTCLPGGTGPN